MNKYGLKTEHIRIDAIKNCGTIRPLYFYERIRGEIISNEQ